MCCAWDLGAPYGVESILLRASALRPADQGAIGHFPRESAGRRSLGTALSDIDYESNSTLNDLKLLKTTY